MTSEQAKLLEVSGEFKGMDGLVRPDSMLLATVVPIGNQTVFVKMVGPEAIVSEERSQFILLCESLAVADVGV